MLLWESPLARLRDVTGEAVLERRAVCCWFRDVTALAQSWTLQMVGFSRCQGESPADRLPGRPGERSEGEARAREQERRESTTLISIGFLCRWF